MGRAGNAIQSIKPVFMMSPLSIAKYIPPGSVSFDIVVFDEASQVRPVEAMGAILRGRQSIVVGDSRQLPPTSFFDSAGGETDEEQSATADLESILGLFCAQGAPERWLRWHYRSRHESLITVSNHEFYDNRLIVFPSPDAGKNESGLRFQHDPDNLYERGGVNVAEAKRVAAAVMENARNFPNLTLGAVAFNLKQARRIEDELEILRRRNPSLEASFFTQHPDEPFFVKNLENVQGDERDVIFISVGYGKLSGGYLPMNFGPLNRDGGERRLNVLITRARRRCVVYSNFLAADLDLRRSKARGIQALKTFLKYADTGILDVPRASGREADSPFEEAMAVALRARGHEIEHQVGSAGFFIDLAVVDPDRPGRYMLGIECDGAKYHSARSARGPGPASAAGARGSGLVHSPRMEYGLVPKPGARTDPDRRGDPARQIRQRCPAFDRCAPQARAARAHQLAGSDGQESLNPLHRRKAAYPYQYSGHAASRGKSLPACRMDM